MVTTDSMADTESKKNRRPWFLTLCCLAAAGALAWMPFYAGPPDGESAPDWVRFIGHFHPALLHLPIGVFALILAQETFGMFRKWRFGPETPMFPMFFGAASAVVAVIAGFLLYHGGGYEGVEVAERHLWGGLIFAIAAVLTFLVRAWTVSLSGHALLFRIMLFGSVGIMGFASHDGATLTHGSDYLTKYAPPFVRTLLKLEKKSPPAPQPLSVDDLVVYADLIAPVFDSKCVQCHKEEKAKGRLRMDTYEMIVKGGKEGPGIEPGSSQDSNIIVRIELEPDDDEHMPPEGKPDLTEEELAVIKWWIDNGADPAKKLRDMEIPDEVKGILDRMTAAVAKTAVAAPLDEALQKQVEEISRQFSGALTYEAHDSRLLVFSAVSIGSGFDDDRFRQLDPVVPHLVSVDLARTGITDKSVDLLRSASNLRSIRLPETAIGDASLDTLAALPHLESINLYGTNVTDEGIAKLASLPNLRHLYLWRTSVSPAMIEKLSKALPACEIVTGTL